MSDAHSLRRIIIAQADEPFHGGAILPCTLPSGQHRKRIGRGALLVLLSTLLAAHVAPGFNNPVLIRDWLFTPDAAPCTQHANFDKGSMGLLRLVFCCPRTIERDAWRAMLGRVLPVLAGTCAAVIAMALRLGYAKFDFKLPACMPVFLTINPFFTCVAEEAQGLPINQ